MAKPQFDNAPAITPLDLQLNHLKDQPKTVFDDMKKSKEGQAPRQAKSKFRYAGIDSRISHLSTLDNENVFRKHHPRQPVQPLTQPK
jgi:hypothetical protein